MKHVLQQPTLKMKQIRVAVGTKNPCKISAVRDCFEKAFDGHEIIITGHGVPSGVSDQPFGDSETKVGATNRARGAYEEGLRLGHVDFGVGLEGGIEIKKTESGKQDLWCMAFMSIIGKTSDICMAAKHPESTFQSSNHEQELCGIAKTAAFPLPKEISRLVIDEKMELGHADDLVFNRVNSKQGLGTVGQLTKGFISRTLYYDHALQLALIPFIWPEHYVDED